MSRTSYEKILNGSGGLWSAWGLFYQYLYSFKICKQVLSNEYSHFHFEGDSDYYAWQSNGDNATRAAVIEVKTKNSDCILKENGRIEKIARKLVERANELRTSDRFFEHAKIEHRLVFNPHSQCDRSCHECFRKANDISNDCAKLKFDPFLSYPIESDAARKMIADVFSSSTEIINALIMNDDSLKDFIRNFIGANYPLLERCSGKLMKKNRTMEISSIKQELSSALSKTVEWMESQDEQRALLASIASKKKRAVTLGNPNYRNPPDNNDQSGDVLCIKKREEACKITAMNLVMGKNDKYFMDYPYRHNDYWEYRAHSAKECVNLRDYLRLHAKTHRSRVRLICAFMQLINNLSKKGFKIVRFTASVPKGYHRYYVKMESDGPRLLLADYNSIVFVADDDFPILSYVKSHIIARAIRFLYYGTTEPAAIKKKVYSALWNDGIVEDLIRWVERQGAIHIDNFAKMCDELFADELNCYPILYSEVSERFIGNVIDARACKAGSSSRSALDSAYASQLLFEKHQCHGERFFLICETDDRIINIGLKQYSNQMVFLLTIDLCINNAIYWYPRRMPVCDQRVPPRFCPTAAVGRSDFWMRD